MPIESCLCPCHEQLVKNKSKYTREKLMTKHYGSKHPCPLNGCWAPEYAGGKHLKVAEKVWGHQEAELILETQGGVGQVDRAPLSAGNWETLNANFHMAKASSMLQLKLKLDFWSRLPWLLCGLP